MSCLSLKLALFLFFIVIHIATTDPVDPKIVSGFTCHPKDFPYLASIKSVNRQIFCGGSVLNRYYILTARHCCTYELDPQQLIIYTGIRQRFSSTQKSRSFTRIMHPESDICIIGLDSPITQNSVTKYANLATTPVFEELMRTKSCNYSLALGFGSQNVLSVEGREDNKGTDNPLLQCVYQRILPVDECEHDDEICTVGAHMISEDTCQGDSGGPLICKGFQVGIVSNGRGCGVGMMSASVRVDMYYDFITKRSNLSNFQTSLCVQSTILWFFLIIIRCF